MSGFEASVDIEFENQIAGLFELASSDWVKLNFGDAAKKYQAIFLALRNEIELGQSEISTEFLMQYSLAAAEQIVLSSMLQCDATAYAAAAPAAHYIIDHVELYDLHEHIPNNKKNMAAMYKDLFDEEKFTHAARIAAMQTMLLAESDYPHLIQDWERKFAMCQLEILENYPELNPISVKIMANYLKRWMLKTHI